MANPFEPPATSSPPELSEEAKALKKLEKKANNIGIDAEKAILVGLIPILGLIFILRLVQWYQLRPRIEGNQKIDRHVRRKFLNAQWRLWVAVLTWPVVILAAAIYLAVS